MATASAAAYAREVERIWSAARDRPVVLSPRDWKLVSDWCGRGLPLWIVREAIESAAERVTKNGPGPLQLGYIAPAVEEAWRVVLDGRSARAAPDAATPEGVDRVDALRRRIEVEPAGTALRAALLRWIAAAEDGLSSEQIDARADEAIPRLLPAGVLDEIDTELDRQLAPFRERVTADRFRQTRRQTRLAAIRRRMNLPRLARETQSGEP